MIIADLEQFIAKSKLITYIRTFVEPYKWRNREQVHKIHRIIELEKWHASTAENPRNLSAYRIIEVFLVLRSVHVVFRNQDRMIFYVNY